MPYEPDVLAQLLRALILGASPTAYIVGTDRTQAVLLPDVLDDYVRPDNPVRFLDAVVAQLDLGTLGFCPRRHNVARVEILNHRAPVTQPDRASAYGATTVGATSAAVVFSRT